MRTLALSIATCAAWAGPGSPLWAQVPEKPGPPPPDTSFWPYAVALVLIFGVGYGVLKSAKRGHQD